MFPCPWCRTTAQGESFPGLLSLVYAYLDTLDVDDKALVKIENYLDLIRRRANGTFPFILLLLSCLFDSGSLQTPATWIRNFVRSHPDYKYDSVVSQETNYDLLVAIDEM